MTSVSVIIPVYQSANTIAEAIDSVLSQTFKDFEIIVVDDGSTDSLEEVLSKYGEKIKLIKQKRLGVSASRNKGIKNSSGEIVAFLDADDIWLPNKLSQQLALFNLNPHLGVVFGNVYFWNGEIFQRKTYFDFSQPYRGKILFPLFAVDFIPLLSIMIRRKVLDKVGLFDESVRFVEDYEMLLRIALNWEFDYVEGPVGAYRIGAQQVSKNFTQVADSLLNMKEKFFLENIDVLHRANRKITNRGLFNKYLRLALWHMRDGKSADAKNALDRYLNVRGVSLIYIAFRALNALPDPLKF